MQQGFRNRSEQAELERADNRAPRDAEPASSPSGFLLAGILDVRRLIVVVLGILIAFAIEAWWDRRGEERATRQHLVALRDDFLKNRQRLDSVAVLLKRGQRSGGQLLWIAQAEENALPADSISSLVGTLFMLAAFRPITSAFDNLVHARELQLIPDRELRLSLEMFKSQVDWLRDVGRWQEEQWVFVNQPYLNEWTDVRDLADAWLDPEARAMLPPARPVTDWRAVLAARTFRNLVLQRMIAADDVLRTQRRVRRQINRILNLIEHDLERR